MASLRAFLMLRTVSSHWEIEVHHDLKDVVRSWAGRSEEVTSAVLHVGFERRVAKSFNLIAAEHVGRVLLTPGAKGALPRSFKASALPVATVDDEPVFLALEGWGYSAPEPVSEDREPEVAAFLGWLGSFASENADDRAALLDVGILDETTYAQFEAKLDAVLRTRLARHRFKEVVGADADDPCAIARAAPPWLAEVPLESLDLTVRIANVFRNRGILKVADLGSLTTAELLNFQNFGRTSIHQLSTILRSAYLAGPQQSGTALLEPMDGTLLQAVRVSLANCSERERDILERRMGLDRDPETLQEIGESYAVTRERIRQIEDKVVARLVRKEVWDDILAAKLRKILADREFPLPLLGAEAIEPWFTGLGEQRSVARYLITNMCSTGAAIVEIAGTEYLGFLSQDAWQTALASARQLLAGGVGARWSRADCEHHVRCLLPDQAGEFGGLLWETASAWCHFADDGGGEILTSYGRGAEQLVEAVLQESDRPLHYSEIALSAARRAGRQIDERRAHNAAADVGFLFAPGTYGLLKHLSVTRAEREALADEAVEIVSEGPEDRQWHASELLEHLHLRGIDLPGRFDKYELDIALKQHGGLTSFGRMVWARSDGTAETARVEIRQAVTAILMQAGRPLSSSELRERLIAVRGINQGMQFAVEDPVIKLDWNTWALNDRDISIKRADQPAFLDEVADVLRETDSGLHAGECSALLGNRLPPRALLCLAARDRRFQSASGGRLSLRATAG
ncbi:DNA-directed RNA polymerase subunit alpha C-terminal domain-containing protein [Altererythrobacter lauratis]|uniref:DNA-directed RNA polymerase subunit alpha C-terminal domain-containing protein n=1 Tax=Alteraurantiacibacter lauratis TaxID=2054627 RepID=A0ABV7EI39_9SPHN